MKACRLTAAQVKQVGLGTLLVFDKEIMWV